PASLSRAQLQQRVTRRMAEEEELAIDPAFFTALPARLPRISSVEIRPKQVRFHNELSQFRYQVLLAVEHEPPPSLQVAWRHWEREGLTMQAVRRLLVETQPDLLAIEHVPNSRLSAENALLAWLAGEDGPQTAGALREALQAHAPSGARPEDFWA